MTTTTEEKSHFKLVSSTKASNVIPVDKYVSEKTGITIIIAGVEGPLVNGFFCFSTEAHDDDGLPHTLEHLIFLGSERYPYKGILDLLANRCLAHGTNAWTDTDHTCYTIYTAGSEGMLTLLPIYLDHILRPTLTEEGFITEVHHIDGEGEDAGVVYCEMQGRENSADSRCELLLLRSMYPNSGYSSETGGIMKNLRTSTNNIKVRAFHKKFYRPENLTIILTGQINAEDVFKALEIVEKDIQEKKQKETQEEWVKPWTTIPPKPNYGLLKEQWPADTEDNGQVLFGWRGPLLTKPKAMKDLTACAVLLRYLCDNAAAPLQRCLVEREDALAGDVSYNLIENVAPLIKIELDNVPIDKLETARVQAFDCLKRLRSGEEPIDMERMRILLRKQLRESYASLESDPHHAVAFRCIGDALYSRTEADFISRLNPQADLSALLKEPQEYWLNLLQKYITDECVTIVGSPSIELQTKMAQEEKNRIEKQRQHLGPEGLAVKAKQLEDAIRFNERPPPPGTIASVPVPSASKLKYHNISTWSSDGAPCPYFDLTQVPVYARVHSLKTNFVYMNIAMDTLDMEEQHRRWLPLLMNALGECPVRRGDILVPHEEVISIMDQLIVGFVNSIGFGKSGTFSVGSFNHLVHIEARCEPQDYEAVVKYLHEILFNAELPKERLLVFAQRMSNEVSTARRHGHKMVYDTLRDSVYKKGSNLHLAFVLRQHKFLKEVIESLNAGGEKAEAVVSEASAAYKKLTEKLWLHLAADLQAHKLSTEPWKQFAPANNSKPTPPRIVRDAELISSSDGGGFVLGVGGIESSFVAQLSPGPLGHAPKEIANLLVAINYFTQLEGPMWRLIRGAGLSYSYSVRMSPNEGRLIFSLYKATNTVPAYTKAKSIFEDFFKDATFNEDLFESAKSTALFETVEDGKCPADVVSQSLIHYLQSCSESYSRDLVQAIAQVTPESAAAAARRWLHTLFEPAASRVAVVCHPNKVIDIQQQFHKMNVKLEAFESIDASQFNK